MSRRNLAWLAGVLAAILVASTSLPVDRLVTTLVETMREAGTLGVALYAGVYLVATILLLPGSLLTLAAGMVYGPWWGLVLISPVSTLGATLSFWVARSLGRDRLQRTLSQHPRLAAMDSAVQRNGTQLIVLLRLSPLVPFNVLNYALGLTPIDTRTYVLASWAGMLPGTLFYCFVGASIPDIATLLDGGVPATGTLQNTAWWIGLLATGVLTWALANVAGRALRETLPTPAEGVVAVFAKPPEPGEVKTRLASTLGDEAASALAQAFLDDTIAEVTPISWTRTIVASTTETPFDDARTETWHQGGGDLGARVERILQRGLESASLAIAIGTDAPGLTKAHLEEAREALTTHDAVLGPATDGGFYLLGLNRCPSGLLEALPWSESDTCEATERRLREQGLSVAHLAALSDIDRPEDLAVMDATITREPGRLHRTRRWLRNRANEPLRVSVILPVLNESQRIGDQLESLTQVGELHEVLVVDGGSTDDTVSLAQCQAGVTVIEGTRGRGAQMNLGASRASGDVLLFLHADVRLPDGALEEVKQAMASPGTVAGAFGVRTVCDDPSTRRGWLMPLIRFGDLRPSYTRLPYGDQALFVDAAVFTRVGGFPELPLMEDLELSRRLRREGCIARCPSRVLVSGRRFLKQPIRSVLIMNTFPLLYALGVSPARLARWYSAIR